MAVAMKIENGIGNHTDDGTEIGKEVVNTEKGIVTVIVLHVKSVTVIVIEIGVTVKEDIVTVTKETEKDARNVHREKTKTEKNQKNNEKKNGTVRQQAQKRPAARKRGNWCRVRRRAEGRASPKKSRVKMLSRERRVSGRLHHDHVGVIWGEE